MRFFPTEAKKIKENKIFLKKIKKFSKLKIKFSKKIKNQKIKK